MSSFILNRFTVNTNGDNLIRTCYSETRGDYLIIKLVIVYRWNENLLLEWHKIILLPFLSKVIPLFHYSPAGKKRSYLRKLILYFFWENKGIMLQTLRGKQKYQIANVGVEKIKLSGLLVQRVNEFTQFNVNHYSNPDRLDKQ